MWARELGEQRRLVGVVGQEQLDLPEPVALPPAEPDEERHRPGRGREPRRLGVEADERHVRRRLARQPGQPLAVERQDDGRRLARARPASSASRTTSPSIASASRSAPSSIGGRDRPPPSRDRGPAAGAGERRPVVREPALERRRPAHARGRAGVACPAPELVRAAAARAPCASTSGSSRGPVQAGQPASHSHARDQLGRAGDQLVVALPEPLATARSRRAPPRRGRSSAPRGAASGPG